MVKSAVSKNKGARAAPARVNLQPNNAGPMVNRIERMGLEDLNAVLKGMPRLNESNKQRVREYLVEGKTMRAIAEAHSCSPELVRSAVARVRLQLNKSLGAWTYVTVSLTLPLMVAEELRGFSDSLAQMQDPEAANAIMKGVLRELSVAKTRIIDHG